MATLTGLFDLYEGDCYTFDFPEGFVLETKKGIKFECSRMSVYRYDEEDRNDRNYYFYEEGSQHWVAKDYYLTQESKSKVCAYLSNLISEGKIKTDKEGYIVQSYKKEAI